MVVHNDNIEELMKFLIVITCIIDFVLRLKGEISCQSFKKKKPVSLKLNEHPVCLDLKAIDTFLFFDSLILSKKISIEMS